MSMSIPLCVPLSSLDRGIADIRLEHARSILYPTDFFPRPNERQQMLIDKFVNTLETYLDVKKTEFSLAGRWQKYTPKEAEGQSLAEYTEKVKAYPKLIPTKPHCDIDRV